MISKPLLAISVANIIVESLSYFNCSKAYRRCPYDYAADKPIAL